MPVDDKAVVDYLARNYASVLARRALCSWGGGAEADTEYDPEPREGWGRMWDKAEEGPAPTRIALVREMLFDAPGEGVLLTYLEAVAEEQYKAEKELADFFIDLLEKKLKKKEQLPILLFLFQDRSSDSVLAALAPALQGAFENEVREALEKNLNKLRGKRIKISRLVLLTWIEFYLEHLIAAVHPEVRRLKAQIEEIKALEMKGAESSDEETSGSNSPDEGVENGDDRQAVFDGIAGQMALHIENLKAMPVEAGPVYFGVGVGVVASLVQLLTTHGLSEEKVSIQLSAIKPIVAALWATR